MIEIIGSIGALLMSLCGFPELIKSFRLKKCDVGWGMLLMWGVGEIALTWYVIVTNPDIILLVNYIFNVLIVLGLVYWKVRGSNDRY